VTEGVKINVTISDQKSAPDRALIMPYLRHSFVRL